MTAKPLRYGQVFRKVRGREAVLMALGSKESGAEPYERMVIIDRGGTYGDGDEVIRFISAYAFDPDDRRSGAYELLGDA